MADARGGTRGCRLRAGAGGDLGHGRGRPWHRTWRRAQASRTAAVEIVGFNFKPATVRIAKGSSVAFSNSSDVQHTATKAGSFDTGRIKPGKSVAVRFAQKGSFAYHCTIHPFMKGKVVVE